jgi:hypothetical protein
LHRARVILLKLRLVVRGQQNFKAMPQGGVAGARLIEKT